MSCVWLQFIADNHTQLKSLNVSHCKNVREPELKLIISGLQELQALDISTSSGKCASISDELCTLLNKQKNKLTSLKIAGWKPPYRGMLESISGLNALTLLDISDFEIKTMGQFLNIVQALSETLEILRMGRVTVLTNTLPVDILQVSTN